MPSRNTSHFHDLHTFIVAFDIFFRQFFGPKSSHGQFLAFRMHGIIMRMSIISIITVYVRSLDNSASYICSFYSSPHPTPPHPNFHPRFLLFDLFYSGARGANSSIVFGILLDISDLNPHHH